VSGARWETPTRAHEGKSEKSPYLRADDTWISISGEVTSVSPDSFMLDYGKASILGEMDDGDRDADGYKLMDGDRVTVNGMIDDDFFESTRIEASSVYVEKLGTTFYASAVEEEDRYYWVTTPTPIVLSQTVVQGTVTEVNDDEFVVDTGLRRIEVEIEDMPYNRLDDEGYQKIGKGDLVRATGHIDDDFFEGRVLEADNVVKLTS